MSGASAFDFLYRLSQWCRCVQNVVRESRLDLEYSTRAKYLYALELDGGRWPR